MSVSFPVSVFKISCFSSSTVWKEHISLEISTSYIIHFEKGYDSVQKHHIKPLSALPQVYNEGVSAYILGGGRSINHRKAFFM